MQTIKRDFRIIMDVVKYCKLPGYNAAKNLEQPKLKLPKGHVKILAKAEEARYLDELNPDKK